MAVPKFLAIFLLVSVFSSDSFAAPASIEDGPEERIPWGDGCYNYIFFVFCKTPSQRVASAPVTVTPRNPRTRSTVASSADRVRVSPTMQSSSSSSTTADTVIESTYDPVTESTYDPVTESTYDPVTESTDDPVTESTDDPVTESTDDPVTESTDDPATESTDDPGNEKTS